MAAPKIPRRAFLKNMMVASALAGIAPALLSSCQKSLRKIPGRIVGQNFSLGHRLRNSDFPKFVREEEIETVIVGGGIAGLSVAWTLAKAGKKDFVVLELDENLGGNSCSGKNSVSAYPWGAHYVPLPSDESREVRELFEELGVIEGYDLSGLPIYNEYYLCHDPHERLLLRGVWQEGLIPQRGVPEPELRQIRAFLDKMEFFRQARGSDGRPAFAIPLDRSSRDPVFLQLDRQTMADFVRAQGWDSPHLLWYVNYCCRDDYGCTMEATSAWAGIHYFASRSGRAANADSQAVLTWPEGNGWIVRKFQERFFDKIRKQNLVYQISPDGDFSQIEVFQADTNSSYRIRARHVVFAAPRFIASRVVADLPAAASFSPQKLSYAPWMVANVTLSQTPENLGGAALAWDNVSYHSQSLGYVVATHQNLVLNRKKTVFTYYLPLTHLDPAAARQEALKKSFAEWSRLVVEDLSRMHFGMADFIENIDVWIWGHGMIRPTPGFIWGQERQELLKPHRNIVFAHSDMSGISIFEEANYRGVEAARSILSAST